MLRFILGLVFLFVADNANGIKCHLQSISKDYEFSTIVFYGKYIGEEQVNYFDYFGDKLIIDNFIVYQVFKGIDKERFKVIRNYKNPYTISLVRDSFDEFDGYPFIKGYEYLVYAYKNQYTGYLTTEGCRRTREIVNNSFISTNGLDKDIGKNEYNELLKLLQQDSVYHFTSWADEIYNRQQKLTNENIDLSRELNIYWLIAIICSVSFLLSIAYIMRLKTKKPG